MRAAHLDYRGYWDLGFVMKCSVCGLVVPVYTDAIPIRGCPVAHYPVLDSDAYIEGGFCRGGHQPSHVLDEIRDARSFEGATAK